MGYVGSRQLGEWVPVEVQALDGGNLPIVPSSDVVAHVYSDSGLVEKLFLSPVAPGLFTGYYGTRLYLGSLYGSGLYSAVVYYVASGLPRRHVVSWDIQPGGDSSGHILSSFVWKRPEVNFVLQQLEDGTIKQGKNPLPDAPEE